MSNSPNKLGRLARWLARSLSVEETDKCADVIVVLGAGVHEDGSLGRSAAERVQVGVEAWKKGCAPWLLLTGGQSDASLRGDLRVMLRGSQGRIRQGCSEAEAMRQMALAMGVPADAIVLENGARSTQENARLSAHLMFARGWRRALLVTQPYHLRRSLVLFEEEGIKALPVMIHDSWIFHGGRESLSALQWILREHIIWILGRLHGESWAQRKSRKTS